VKDRWRIRRGGFAIAALLAIGAGLPAANAAGDAEAPAVRWELTVRDGSGDVLLRAPLPASRFALRYRNSVYGSVAEERFAIASDGRLVLVELAADEAAVLEEYYAVTRGPMAAPAGDPRAWRASPATPPTLDALSLAATKHGRRTLVLAGQPSVALWQLVGDGPPGVTLTVDQAP
jgi:hypothetical protein